MRFDSWSHIAESSALCLSRNEVLDVCNRVVRSLFENGEIVEHGTYSRASERIPSAP